MKVIKKNIKQALITGVTEIDGVEYINIIPDLNAVYNLTFLLEKEETNLGFFDVYDFSGVTGTTITPEEYTVTGKCSSRLLELRKYSQQPLFIKRYYLSNNIYNNGVNISESVYNTYPMKIVYYIDGISYIDYIENNTGKTNTFFYFKKTYPSEDFLNKPYYKDPHKDNLSGDLNLSSNVFINRPNISIFEKNYNMEYINNLSDLKSYVAGNYYIIYKLN